jgi:aspartyl protease family protein
MNRTRHCMACLALFLCGAPVLAADVNVVGLFPGKAVVSINGAAPRTLREGQKTEEGVTLLSSERDSATFDIDGKKRVLKMGQVYTAPASASAPSVTLSADSRGHFFVNGQVNGASVRFLVDTGATWVSLSGADARRLAIDYHKGEPRLMSTANGVAAAYKVLLDSVRVGDVTVSNVEAVVMDGAGPGIALLGMSFLNRMEMRRTGETMLLIRKY